MVKPPESPAYAMEELVSDCARVAEALGETTAVIVGQDWAINDGWFGPATPHAEPKTAPATSPTGPRT
jgi:hypothetical protein